MTRASEAAHIPVADVHTQLVPDGGYVVAPLQREVRAWVGEESSTLRSLFSVRALSPHAVWLEAHAGTNALLLACNGTCRLWLEWQELRVGPFAIDLLDVKEPEWVAQGKPRKLKCAVTRGSTDELGPLARFVQALVESGALQPPSQSLAGRDKIRDPEEIAELLTLFSREGRVGTINSDGERVSVRIAAVDVAARTMTLEHSGTMFAAPAMLTLSHLHAAFEIPLSPSAGSGQIVPFPEWVSCSTRRRFRRAVAPSGLQAHFVHPYSPGLKIVAPLVDVSRSGLSFSASLATSLLYPGLPIADLLVCAGEEVVARLSGQVRSCKRDESGALTNVGVALDAGVLWKHERLRELLDAALYPSTHTRASEVWDVHASSGYLSLSGKSPADFDRVRSSFVRAAQKLSEAPAMASIAYWPEKGPVQATISHFKAYQSTWLVCQLSKRKGAQTAADSRTGIRDMYLRIYETAQADPDTRWLLSYVQDLAPGWSRSVHVGIPKRYAAVGDACLVPFRALEVDVANGAPQAATGAVRVTSADPVLARAAVRDLHRIRPAQYLDALDLTEGRLDLSVISTQWREAGLQRRREMFVAHVDGVRCAFAVAETAEPGVHLYGLMDCLRMYPLRAGGEGCFAALLAEARTWFARQGRDRFAYLEEFPVDPQELGISWRNLGTATLTLLSVDRIPELLRRVADLASLRPPAKAVQVEGGAHP